MSPSPAQLHVSPKAPSFPQGSDARGHPCRPVVPAVLALLRSTLSSSRLAQSSCGSGTRVPPVWPHPASLEAACFLTLNTKVPAAEPARPTAEVSVLSERGQGAGMARVCSHSRSVGGLGICSPRGPSAGHYPNPDLSSTLTQLDPRGWQNPAWSLT